jgi:hypothetical protein
MKVRGREDRCDERVVSYHAVEKPPAIMVAAYTPLVFGNVYKTE